MNNGNLNCSATNCAFNCEQNCFAGGIIVSGPSAVSTVNTCCSSFQEKTAGDFTNCAGGCTCTTTDRIQCNAHNCEHNHNNCCKASAVKINAADASCETFRCK